MRKGQIIQASEFMRRVAQVSGLQMVVLRAGMVWTDPESGLLKPPLTTLASRHEEALRLYLHAIFLAQALENPGDVHTGFQRTLGAGAVPGLTWSRLLAMNGTHRNTVLRVQRSMRALHQYELAEIPTVGSRPDYSGFRILSEDGRGMPYRCPGGPYSNISRGLRLGPEEFAIPASLFVNGWSLVLSVSEIAMILLFSLLERKYGLQNRHVFISRASRLRSTGLSDEVYLGHRGLAEFGLLELADPTAKRRRGRVSPAHLAKIPPLNFRLKPRGLDRSAIETVIRRLGSPVAPHLRLTEAGKGVRLRTDYGEDEYQASDFVDDELNPDAEADRTELMRLLSITEWDFPAGEG